MRLVAVLLGASAIVAWLALVYGDFWNGLDLGEPLGEEREDSVAGVALGVVFIGCVLSAIEAWKRGSDEMFACPECAQEFSSSEEYDEHYETFHSAPRSDRGRS